MSPKKIKIGYHYLIPGRTGTVQEEIDFCGATLLELLDQIFDLHEEHRLQVRCWDSRRDRLAPGIALFVNQRQVPDLTLELHDGDEVLIAPLLSGG